MIENKKQYWITKKLLAEIKQSLNKVRIEAADTDIKNIDILAIYMEAYQSEIEVLSAQIKEYKGKQNGKYKTN